MDEAHARMQKRLIKNNIKWRKDGPIFNTITESQEKKRKYAKGGKQITNLLT